MKAVGYKKSLPITDSESLIDLEIDPFIPGKRDLLVEVKAISVNPVDYKIRQRQEPEGDVPKILGWDAAGVVSAVGEDVTHFKVGDEVYYAGDLTRQGCNAEFHVVDERIVGIKPKTLHFSEAAALPLTTLTAWELLFDRFQMETIKPSRILIVGAAGGVGSIMVQLLKQCTPATVIATASREQSITWLKDLGADEIIDHTKPLSQGIASLGIDTVDYVASLNCTVQHYEEIIKVLKPQGKLGVIDNSAGIDTNLMKDKSISLHWEFMYTRSMFQTPDMEQQREILNRVSAMIDEGKIRTTVAHHLGTINAANLRRAHQMLEGRIAHGKIVLEGF